MISKLFVKATRWVSHDSEKIHSNFWNYQALLPDLDIFTNVFSFSRRYAEVFQGLTISLANIGDGLTLKQSNGFDVGGEAPGDGAGTGIGGLAIGFIVATCIIGVMFVFLAITYFIRTRK